MNFYPGQHCFPNIFNITSSFQVFMFHIIRYVYLRGNICQARTLLHSDAILLLQLQLMTFSFFSYISFIHISYIYLPETHACQSLMSSPLILKLILELRKWSYALCICILNCFQLITQSYLETKKNVVSGWRFKCNSRCTLFSYVMVYSVGHTIEISIN